MERRRRVALAVVVVLSVALLGLQAATAGGTVGPEGPTADPGSHPAPADGERGRTLISVQSFGGFGNNGRAMIVDADNNVVWQFDPPDTRVFDAEVVDGGNILVSTAKKVPAADCPAEHLERDRFDDHCVRNRVLELEYPSNAVVWNYSWYDETIHWHEVHDADRLANGETAIIDMGNNRAFTVAQNGTITWSWSAERHLGEGSQFRERYGGPEKRVTEGDWTHMNDIDRLSNGHFQLSIRNFDVVVEVDPETNEVVDVVGRPGNHTVMQEQHNPMRLPASGTLLVADSENDRVVEVDVETGEVVWTYGGTGLTNWPRDADRLPNGNTLVVDTYNNRVVEVTPAGDVVWQHRVAVREDGTRELGLPYEADRLSLDGERLAEEQVPNGSVAAPGGDGRTSNGGFLARHFYRVQGWVSLYLPVWVGVPELLTGLVGGVAALALLVDGARYEVGRWRDGGSEDEPPADD